MSGDRLLQQLSFIFTAAAEEASGSTYCICYGRFTDRGLIWDVRKGRFPEELCGKSRKRLGVEKLINVLEAMTISF